MATFTPDKISPETAAEVRPAEQADKLHTGPVARLLARVSKWSNDYAEYQMDAGTWRKLAL